jgi:hypothetical protein
MGLYETNLAQSAVYAALSEYGRVNGTQFREAFGSPDTLGLVSAALGADVWYDEERDTYRANVPNRMTFQTHQDEAGNVSVMPLNDEAHAFCERRRRCLLDALRDDDSDEPVG